MIYVFLRGFFKLKNLEVVYTKVKDLADLSAMAVSAIRVMLMLNRAKSLHHLKTAQKHAFWRGMLGKYIYIYFNYK
jgi:hypothetical protein